MHVLVVLLHACFSVVGPIPFLLATFFFPGHPYIRSTTVFPDYVLPTHSIQWITGMGNTDNLLVSAFFSIPTSNISVRPCIK